MRNVHSLQAVHLTDNDFSWEGIHQVRSAFKLAPETEHRQHEHETTEMTALKDAVSQLRKAKRANVTAMIKSKGGVGKQGFE